MRQVAILTHLSIRSVRRRIREGAYVVVRLSPRRLRIDAQRSVVYGLPLSEWQTDREWLAQKEQRILERLERLVRPDSDLLFTVRWLARLTGKSKREIYHDVQKGALPVEHRQGRVGIRLRDAIVYIDDRTALIPWAENYFRTGFFGPGDRLWPAVSDKMVTTR